jgi:tetratricopeptide (TPR) repeat protein
MTTLREPPALQLQYWKESLSAREGSPTVFVGKLGWGRQSNQEIASKYDKAWLDQIDDAGKWLKIGFALYDAKRYEDALAAFEKMQALAGGSPHGRMLATLWQGHMLDLLGKRQAAIAKYRIVAEMNVDESEQRHDQYRLAYTPSPYARERMASPFVRVENRDDD